MGNSIKQVLQRLQEYIEDHPERCYFGNPAGLSDIRAVEKELKIKLPASYISFLCFADGGMIIAENLTKLLSRPDGLETAQWNANCLLGLSSLKEAFLEMKRWNFGYPGENIGSYPFIPFCRTATGEKLVFINRAGENESPVLDAFHEDTPEEYGIVSDDFSQFLSSYIEKEGDPEVIGHTSNIPPALLEIDSFRTEDESDDDIMVRTSRQIDINPYDHWAMIERGMVYVKQENYSLALEDFNRAIELLGNNAFYYAQRASLWKKVGKYRAALIDYDISLKMKPDDVYYLSLRAEVLYEMGKYNESLEDLNHALKLDNRDLLAYLIREQVYRSMGNNDLADADASVIAILNEENNDDGQAPNL